MGTQLLAHHGISDVIAFGGRGERSKVDLLRDAARIAQALPASNPNSCVELVFQGDRYHLAAALLGALYRGHAVHLPPSHQRDVVMAVMEASKPVAVLHDTTVGAPTRVDLLLAEEADPTQTTPLDSNLAGTVHFHAENGSVHTRTWNSLVSEARMLSAELQLGRGCRVLSTLPPSRALGLVVSVLVPLVSGATMLRPIFPRDEDLLDLLRGGEDATLLTSPHVLRRLGGSVTSVRQLLISPTLGADREAVLARWPRNTEVRELVTGPSLALVGQRDARQSAPFAALSGVALKSLDGKELEANAEYLVSPCATQHVAQLLDETTFTDVGPAQEVLGDGERMVSLGQLRDVLLEAQLVQDAALCLVPANEERNARVLCAAIAPESEEEALTQVLQAHLGVLPAQVQVLKVDRLARAADGTCKAIDVLRLFGLGKSGQPPNYAIEWGAQMAAADGAEHTMTARLPANSAYFDGHFPGYPILPAAAQLSALIVPAVRKTAPDLGRLKRMVRLKFLGRIRAEDTVEITLRRAADSPSVQFQLCRDGKLCAVGTLEFEQQNR